MALTLNRVVRYIPEFNRERERYEAGENDKPLTFHIQTMGAQELREFSAQLNAVISKVRGANAEEVLANATKMSETNKAMFALYQPEMKQRIREIENLDVDGKSIKNGDEFYNHPSMPNELVLEIERALSAVNYIEAEEAKNSEGSSQQA